MKKVSVIIPAYNKAEYTRRTVESVLAQTYPHIEIIVVDDGSKDQTPSVMAGYGNRIEYIYKANEGACSARNEGIRRATGEYVAFLDCDDLYCVNKIQRCVEYLEKNMQFGFVYTAAYFIDEYDEIVGRYDNPHSSKGWITSKLILDNFICNSTVLVKKCILQKEGLFDEKIFTPADWDMWLRLSEISQAGYIPEPLTKYRVVDNFVFNRLQQARQEDAYVLEKFFKNHSTQGILKKRAFSNFYLRFALCAFIKNDLPGFWSDCRTSFKLAPWNMKVLGIAALAMGAPRWLKKELEKRILRKSQV
jgi:glycosyltransferase involved in cell wall biosynthesis